MLVITEAIMKLPVHNKRV